MTEMRVLTVRQPWAWAILQAGKDVENRVRNIAGDYRGLVAIHVGLQYDRAWSSPAMFDAMSASGAHTKPGEYPWHENHGAIIGIVNLWAVHQDRAGGSCCPHRPSGGPGGSAWAERDAWHLCLNEPRSLAEPIRYRGALGLRRLDDGTVARVLAGLP